MRRKLVMFVLLLTLIYPLVPAQAQDMALLAAGDIAACTYTGDDKTAEILDKNDGLIAALGDVIQSEGTIQQYTECFGPAWGRHKDRIQPTPGNHDYQADGGAAYFEYFGGAAGEPGKGWRSFNYGTWHIIVLNSMVPADPNSEQIAWLKADLAANPAACTLAYFHHPVFHSGAGGLTGRMNHAFRALYEAGADVVLSGDAHHYERFAPMSPSKRIEPERGIRQFVVGTGGGYHTRLGAKWRATEAREANTWGVLRLVLSPGSYSWQFLPVDGETFTDSGAASCVNP